MRNWVKVGKVKDAQGLKGEVFVIVFSGEFPWASALKTVQIGVATYEVQTTRAHKGGLVIKLKNIQDRTQAEALKGKFFFIAEEHLVSQAGEAIFLKEIENFKVVDSQLGEIGVITGFATNQAQDLLVVEGAKGTFEIPFVEAFIVEISHTKKTVTMKLPEGLLEINESN